MNAKQGAYFFNKKRKICERKVELRVWTWPRCMVERSRETDITASMPSEKETKMFLWQQMSPARVSTSKLAASHLSKSFVSSRKPSNFGLFLPCEGRKPLVRMNWSYIDIQNCCTSENLSFASQS